MAVVTESIGTSSRDHSTITLWEANLDDDPTYDAADDAVGECYNDSVFDEDVLVNGGATIGLASILLSVASGERHDGTSGIGVRITRTAFSASVIVNVGFSAVDIQTVEWLEVERTNITHVIGIAFGVTQGGDTRFCSNCIIHDMPQNGTGNPRGIQTPGNNAFYNILNNIVYNIESTDAGSNTAIGIESGAVNSACLSLNNTVHNISNSNASNSGSPVGFFHDDDANFTFKNNISTDTSTAGSGSPVDFTAVSSATSANNLSSDTSASGTGSLTEKASSDQFVSTTGGSEDLHLKSGADAIDAGADLGTTPSGVEIDINGRDRDAEGDTWDMGAHEFVASLTPPEIITMLNRDKINPIRLM